MGPSTRARPMFFLIGHTQDTYGQMAVYLRLNGRHAAGQRAPAVAPGSCLAPALDGRGLAAPISSSP